MVETVVIFALLSAAFELVLVAKLPLRARLRLLGSPRLTLVVHLLFIGANLVIHFGTVTGSMTAIVAGLTSFLVMPLARRVFGYVRDKRYYPGIKRYTTMEVIG